MATNDSDTRKLHPIERRTHSRIQVSLAIRVASEAGHRSATLRELSRGGAQFVVDAPLAPTARTLELALPVPDSKDVYVVGEIVRRQPTPHGELVSVVFSDLPGGLEEALGRLERLLLSGDGGGQRQFARVSRRMSVSASELGRGQLENISAGGVSIVVSEAPTGDEEIVVMIPDSAGHDLLTMRARVVNQRLLPDGRIRVGMSFVNLTPERQACLQSLLAHYLATPPSDDDFDVGV